MEPRIELEDISALSFSHRDSDISKLKNSVRKVAKESEKGKALSRQLVRGVHPTTLKQIRFEENSS